MNLAKVTNRLLNPKVCYAIRPLSIWITGPMAMFVLMALGGVIGGESAIAVAESSPESDIVSQFDDVDPSQDLAVVDRDVTKKGVLLYSRAARVTEFVVVGQNFGAYRLVHVSKNRVVFEVDGDGTRAGQKEKWIFVFDSPAKPVDVDDEKKSGKSQRASREKKKQRKYATAINGSKKKTSGSHRQVELLSPYQKEKSGALPERAVVSARGIAATSQKTGLLAPYSLEDASVKTKIADKKIRVSKKRFRKEMGDFGKLSEQVDVSIESKGLRVVSIQKKSFVDSLGLQAGDIVVSIAGTPMTSLDNAATAYSKVHKKSRFSSMILRGDAKFKITYIIR